MADSMDFLPLLTRLFGEWQSGGEERTRAEFARRMDVSPSLVTHWLAGRVRPDVTTTLPRMCAVFGLAVTDARELYEACGVSLGPILDGAELGDGQGVAS